MFSLINLILLYPYPYKTFAVIISALIISAIALPIYGIYKLIIRRMTERTKAIFHRVLKIIGICLLVIFIAEIIISFITTHQVNKQLGFYDATPETPEGEFFIITKVIPGGVMAKAGLKPDDQVLMQAVGDLYRLLINNQGEEVSFLILRDNKEVTISAKVPLMELPLRRVTFLY
jgi:hypothetical protein